MTLREGDREYFYKMLDRHFPGLKRQYEKKYGLNYAITSDNNKELMTLFYKVCTENNIICNNEAVFKFMNTLDERAGSGQIELFE